MINGTHPTRLNHKDRDLHLSFGSVVPPSFPPEYLTDCQPFCPNQEIEDTNYIPPVAPEPYGCTNETQSSLAIDLVDGKIIYRPDTLDNITNANANGGYDIRQSLLITKAMSWIAGFYNITPTAGLDFFDSLRLAQYIENGVEKRSVSWGTPWYSEWEASAYTPDNPSAIMPMPKSLSTTGLSWHNSSFKGWKTINGVPYLVNKSWQGNHIGDNGYLYFSREVVNAVMTVNGTVAFTATNLTPKSIVTISVTTVQLLVSIIKNWLGLQ